jgi:hypothetical protein
MLSGRYGDQVITSAHKMLACVHKKRLRVALNRIGFSNVQVWRIRVRPSYLIWKNCAPHEHGFAELRDDSTDSRS